MFLINRLMLCTKKTTDKNIPYSERVGFLRALNPMCRPGIMEFFAHSIYSVWCCLPGSPIPHCPFTFPPPFV